MGAAAQFKIPVSRTAQAGLRKGSDSIFTVSSAAWRVFRPRAVEPYLRKLGPAVRRGRQRHSRRDGDAKIR